MSQPDSREVLSGIDLGRIDHLERIKHGLTNDSWLVRSDAGQFVVRRSNTSEESLQINRQSEALILEVVARAGIGPEVMHCDPAGHLLVTRYAGPTWTESQATDPANIGRVAALLRRLHAIEPPAGIQIVDLSRVVEGYLLTLDQHGESNEATSSQLRERAHEVTSFLGAAPETCLCHNDIHALNIVDDGGLRLIDWEYAGLGERLFDLASICVYHRYSGARRESLLSGYLGGADGGRALQRLEACCWLFDYIRDLWTAVRELDDLA